MEAGLRDGGSVEVGLREGGWLARLPPVASANPPHPSPSFECVENPGT